MDNNSSRHAYLIIAHDKFGQLKKLLQILDDERNDIFIHIDKKAGDFPRIELKNACTRSKVTFTERISVIWGAYSQIESELILMKAAAPGHYGYYHLLSGADLPIKTQDEIHEFFRVHKGEEFLDFEGPVFREEKKVLMSYYYFFQENYAGRSKFLDLFDQISIRIQKLVGIDRLKGKDITLQKGANWFSITDDFLKYALEKEELIRDLFLHSKCCDEVFLQTLAVNSPFKERLADPEMSGGSKGFARYIDWNRGGPYTFRTSDFEELMSTEETKGCMFARKFDEMTDGIIIDRIQKALLS